MKRQTLVEALFAALGLGIVATAAEASEAVTITIEPDNGNCDVDQLQYELD